MGVITFFITLAILGTVALLFAGGVSMAHGGKFDKIHSEEFMWMRVVMQGIALGLIVIATLFWT